MEIKDRNITISGYFIEELSPITINTTTEWFEYNDHLYFKVNEREWKPLFPNDILEIKIKGNVIYRKPNKITFNSSAKEMIIDSLDYITQKILVKYKGRVSEMRFPSKKEVLALRKEYPKNTRVELMAMDDPQAPPISTKGTVTGVDDTGTIMVRWDNGSGLNVIYGVDKVKKSEMEEAK